MALRTQKPNVDDFISGAPAPAATPAKPAKPAKPEKPAKAPAKKAGGRGKSPSLFMADIDAAMSRYQLRIPPDLHAESKGIAANLKLAYCDFILGAMVGAMAEYEADKAQLHGPARKSFVADYINARKQPVKAKE